MLGNLELPRVLTRRNNIKALPTVVLASAISSASHAALVTYQMGDHPDSSLYNSPNTGGPNGPYGLRGDALLPPAGNGPTFSVGDNLGGAGGVVTLTFDNADDTVDATLQGTLVNNYDGSSWTVDYTLDVSSTGANGFTASSGSGTLSKVGGSTVYTLTGKAMNGDVFLFKNDGHRLGGHSSPTDWVARGWLVHTAFSSEPKEVESGQMDYNDWLMVGTDCWCCASVERAGFF